MVSIQDRSPLPGEPWHPGYPMTTSVPSKMLVIKEIQENMLNKICVSTLKQRYYNDKQFKDSNNPFLGGV